MPLSGGSCTRDGSRMVLASRRDAHVRERAEGRLAALLAPPSSPPAGAGPHPDPDPPEVLGVGSGSLGWTPAPPAPVPDPDAEFWEPATGRGRHRSAGEARGRSLVERTIPSTVRLARWTVPWRAAAAVVVVAAALAGVLALRSAAAVPGEPVPLRPVSEHGPSASGPPGVSTTTAPASSTPDAHGAPSSDAQELVIHVVGQVAEPGVVRLPAGARVGEALEEAGGPLATADLARVNLARPLVDGEQIVVPRPGEPLAPGAQGAPAAGGATTPGGSGAALVSLNTADLKGLDTLPGIGPVLAQRILDWRDQHGSFSTVDELGEVSGIGDKLLEQLRPLVTV